MNNRIKITPAWRNFKTQKSSSFPFIVLKRNSVNAELINADQNCIYKEEIFKVSRYQKINQLF